MCVQESFAVCMSFLSNGKEMHLKLKELVKFLSLCHLLVFCCLCFVLDIVYYAGKEAVESDRDSREIPN